MMMEPDNAEEESYRNFVLVAVGSAIRDGPSGLDDQRQELLAE
jgi:hypothetical protein